MNNILVTGATGILGSSVIETLLTQIQPNQINIITRKEEKRAEFQGKGFNAYLGDYNDIVALKKAMENIDTVLLISSGDQGDRMQEHKNVIDTAKKCGVENIAYTSRALKDRTTLANKLMLEHFETEDYIKESGLKYILFRNALYLDVVPLFVGEKVFETGIFMPAGNGKVAYALRQEQGEAMANVLLNENFENQTYKFTGNESYSFYDVATALTELSGKEVKYTAVEIPAFENIMKQKGLPNAMVKKIVDFNMDIKNGQEAEVTNELELKLERKPTALKDGLKTLFNL
ncbi:MAG: SDR family oxidoreductase [Pelobium sp.]